MIGKSLGKVVLEAHGLATIRIPTMGIVSRDYDDVPVLLYSPGPVHFLAGEAQWYQNGQYKGKKH